MKPAQPKWIVILKSHTFFLTMCSCSVACSYFISLTQSDAVEPWTLAGGFGLLAMLSWAADDDSGASL